MSWLTNFSGAWPKGGATSRTAAPAGPFQRAIPTASVACTIASNRPPPVKCIRAVAVSTSSSVRSKLAGAGTEISIRPAGSLVGAGRL
jgi:hypothetical protein